MATHSSTLAWKIPWMEEPGRLQTDHGVARSQTWLSDFIFTFHFHAWEKEMATHSSGVAWRIPGMAEPGGLPSMELHRVRHDLAASRSFQISAKMSFLQWGLFQQGSSNCSHPVMFYHNMHSLSLLNVSHLVYLLICLKSLPRWLSGKEFTSSVGDSSSIPGLGRSSGKRNGNPLWYSYWGNSMDRGAWQAIVDGVTKSWTWLSD